jgi:hypothetical protein
MNMHMPQDEESELELRHLAAVPYQIISPAKNESIIGIFQDSLLGSFLFTREKVDFTAFTNLYTSRTGPELAVLLTKYKNRKGWTHRDVISLLHINPADMKDDGARMVLEWFMKEDKPQRKTRTGEVVPASYARSEFLKRLQSIETPALPATESPSPSPSPPQLPSQSLQGASHKLQVKLLTGGLAGDTVTLQLTNSEPFSNLVKTLAAIGAGKYMELRVNAEPISPTETIDSMVKKYASTSQPIDFKTVLLFAREVPEPPATPTLTAAPAAPAAPAATAATQSSTDGGDDDTEGASSSSKPQESPVVAVARFLKALIDLSNEKIAPDAALTVMNRVRRIQREHLPTHLMSSPGIWTHLLKDMGMTALIRNLNKLSSTGVVTSRRQEIVAMLCDDKQIKSSRVHPFAVLVAMKVYKNGKGELGSMVWPVDSYIVTALSTTFLKSFGNIPRTGKRIMVALDVSGSMTGAYCAGSTSVTCREGSVAMAMATIIAERDENRRLSPNTHVYSFTTTFKNVTNGFSTPGLTLEQAIRATDDAFGGTDCALPMTYATQARIPIDAFIVYTDSETYAPTIHPQGRVRGLGFRV